MLMTADDLARQKVIFALAVYPRLTMSMMQIAVGPHVVRDMWRPALMKLVGEGTVRHVEKEVVTPQGQFRIFKYYELAKPDEHSLDSLRILYLRAAHQETTDESEPSDELLNASTGVGPVIDHQTEEEGGIVNEYDNSYSKCFELNNALDNLGGVSGVDD
jgi:hypothetical protein